MFEGRIAREKADLAQIIRKLEEESSKKGGGALVIFIGFVKGVVNEAEVQELRYEAYEPYASKKLDEIAKSYADREDVYGVVILHRVGSLRPGDETMYVLVAAKDRGTAFSVAREVVDRVKHSVPIFKLEVRSDGEYWVVGDSRRVRRE